MHAPSWSRRESSVGHGPAYASPGVTQMGTSRTSLKGPGIGWEGACRLEFWNLSRECSLGWHRGQGNKSTASQISCCMLYEENTLPAATGSDEQGNLVPAPCAGATSRTIRTLTIIKALDIASLHKMTLIRSCRLSRTLTSGNSAAHAYRAGAP